MKTKWYLSAFIVVLTLFGIVQNNTSSPNQEVIVRFDTQKVTSQQSQQAIDFVEKQLQAVGITNIKVEKLTNHQLKISYHSTVDVLVVKSILSKTVDNTSVAVNAKDIKGHKKSGKKTVDFDVYEIQKSTQHDANSTGKCVLVTKQDYDRSSNIHYSAFFGQNIEVLTFKAYAVGRSIASQNILAKYYKTYTIPEVRAGPFQA